MDTGAILAASKLNIDRIVEDALEANIDQVETITRDQLRRSELPDGSQAPTYRNPAYNASKPRPSRTGKWNYDLTGRFKRGITAAVAKRAITWPESLQESKYNELREKTGLRFGGPPVDILSWNELSIQIALDGFLIEAIRDEMRKKIFN